MPSSAIFIPQYIQLKSIISTCLILGGIFSVSACTSLKHSPQQLSSGIQKIYAVPSTTANKVSPLILQSAEKHNVPATLIAAVIHQESSYRAHVRSSSGAIGLMQIIPRFWQQSCPGDLYNEAININCGSYILAQYYSQAGSWNKALAYYNVGPSGYENSFGTRQKAKKYAKSVQKHEKNLKKAL